MDLKNALAGLNLELMELQTRVPGQTEPAYYRPMTLALSDKIQREIAHMGDHVRDGTKLAVTVIHCVLKADGTPMFSKGDRQMLMTEVPQEYLIELVQECSGQVSIEDAEGN